MSGSKELVESLGGTVLFGGIIVQFSDTTFEQAVKKIYDMGVEAEREQVAQFIETGYVRQFENPWRDDLSAAIRARK